MPQDKRKSMIGLREHTAGFEGMIEVTETGGFPPEVVIETVTLEDIMVHIGQQERQDMVRTFLGVI